MKRLINPKTKEIAYIDLYTNTIHFSNSNTSHKAIIHKDPNTHKITKITSSPDPIPNPTPVINKSDSNSNNKPISDSTPNPNSNPTKKHFKINSIEPVITFMDDYSLFEMIPETEIFDSPDSFNPLIPTSTYKITA